MWDPSPKISYSIGHWCNFWLQLLVKFNNFYLRNTLSIVRIDKALIADKSKRFWRTLNLQALQYKSVIAPSAVADKWA